MYVRMYICNVCACVYVHAYMWYEFLLSSFWWWLRSGFARSHCRLRTRTFFANFITHSLGNDFFFERFDFLPFFRPSRASLWAPIACCWATFSLLIRSSSATRLLLSEPTRKTINRYHGKFKATCLWDSEMSQESLCFYVVKNCLCVCWMENVALILESWPRGVHPGVWSVFRSHLAAKINIWFVGIALCFFTFDATAL